MIKMIGKHVQYLSIAFDRDACQKFSKEIIRLIDVIKGSCTLKEIILSVTGVIKSFEKSERVSLACIATLIHMNQNLESLKIHNWPIQFFNQSDDVNLLNPLYTRPYSRLTELNYLAHINDQQDWVSLMLWNPCREEMVMIVSHLPNLQWLSMRIYALHDEVLDVLCQPGRASLKQLDLLMVCSTSIQDGLLIEVVSAEKWKHLNYVLPRLKITATFFNSWLHFHSGYYDYRDFFKREINLFSLICTKYAILDERHLEFLGTNYSESLTTFIFYGDNPNIIDDTIVSMVLKCSRLVNLLYYGKLHTKTVKTLAEIRKQKWRKFEMMDHQLEVAMNHEEIDDDNKVIGMGEGGEVYIILQDAKTARRRERLRELYEHVSIVLERTWTATKRE